MSDQPFRGVVAPVLTPFTEKGAVDQRRFVGFCRWLMQEGVDGLAVFGTTSEANSLSMTEKTELLDAAIEAGIPAARFMPGTGACALPDAVALTRHAVAKGCGAVLMLPPFYYKNVSDDGLFAFYSEVIQQVGSAALRVYLYHIPPVSQVPISLDLVARLREAYPKTVVGLKDSSGDWNNTKAMLERFPGFGTFAGSEVFLLDTLRGGGAGCITASGNVNVAGCRKVFLNWQGPDADALQAEITAVRKAIQAYPLIPALKRIVAHYHDDPDFARLRPPLQALNAEMSGKLIADLKALGFAMSPRATAAAA